MTLFKINLGAKDQGHKSKIKVTEVKSVFFSDSGQQLYFELTVAMKCYRGLVDA